MDALGSIWSPKILASCESPSTLNQEAQMYQNVRTAIRAFYARSSLFVNLIFIFTSSIMIAPRLIRHYNTFSFTLLCHALGQNLCT